MTRTFQGNMIKRILKSFLKIGALIRRTCGNIVCGSLYIAFTDIQKVGLSGSQDEIEVHCYLLKATEAAISIHLPVVLIPELEVYL